MPKVSKKEGRAAAAVLEAVPLPMETTAEDERPAASAPAQGEQPSTSAPAPKPSFAPVSAFDQSGRRVEFRRVRCRAASATRTFVATCEGVRGGGYWWLACKGSCLPSCSSACSIQF